jgi:signal transduction histidine kinase
MSPQSGVSTSGVDQSSVHPWPRVTTITLATFVSGTVAFASLAPRLASDPAFVIFEALAIAALMAAGLLFVADPQQQANGYALIGAALLEEVKQLGIYAYGPLPIAAWVIGPLSVIPIALVLLRYPQTTLRGHRAERIWLVVATGWLVATRVTVAVPLPEARKGWWPVLPESPNLRIDGNVIANVGLAVLAALFVVLLIRRLTRLRGNARREAAPVVLTALAATAAAATHALIVRAARVDAPGWIVAAESALLLAIPVSFLLAAVLHHIARSAVSELLQRLDRPIGALELESSLARTLSDPSLKLALWLPEVGQWGDAVGQRISIPTNGRGSFVPIDRVDGSPLAAVIVDSSTHNDSWLLTAAVNASRLALENVQLQESLRAQLSEVRESRTRIAQAAFDERRRVERDLHDGVQQRMLALAATLGQVRQSAVEAQTKDLATQASRELSEALRELRDLARGIHPALLSAGGLRPAVNSLAERLPVPVINRIPDGRLPTHVESTAYFVICEAVTNAIRHAESTRIEVTALRSGTAILVDIRDDGHGGARLAGGTGLRGLADRVAAMGGDLSVNSPSGSGTCVSARIPCE